AALLAEEEKLANADALHAAATTAHEALLGDPASASVDASDVVTLLGIAGRALEAVRAHDAALGGLGDRLSEASYLISDVAAELASYTESLDADPARLAAVQERRAALGRLVRAYGAPAGDVATVLDWAKLAAALTGLRAAAAEKFATEVTAELTALAMPHASLTAVISELDEPGPYGAD